MVSKRFFTAALVALSASSCIPEPPPREGTRVLVGEHAIAHVGEPPVEYPLDAIERHVEDGSPRVQCDQDSLIDYSGTNLRYHAPVKIVPAFQERLERFEQVVSEVSTEVYGRPPRRIRHMGAFSCRTSRNRSYRLSEHALGNAIDVAGFDFGPATAEQPLASGLPKSLARPFEVRVLRHWNKTGEPAEIHARFLTTLTDRLTERRDIFRSAIGPSHPGHHDHFHFDMSPWRFVRL